MMTITPLISEFTAIGELKNLTVKSDGRVKYLLLSTEGKEYSIKIPKGQPKKLISRLEPGCEVKITGIVKQKPKKQRIEYKASSIKLLTAPAGGVTQLKAPKAKSSSKKSSDITGRSAFRGNLETTPAKSSAKILICKKSNCWKKGGKASYEALKTELAQKGISDSVDIKLTGCLKKCKKAPNLIALPDKKHYTKVKPKQVATIVEKHLS